MVDQLKQQCRLLISCVNSPSTGVRSTSIVALHSMLLNHPRTYAKLFNASNRSSMLTILLNAINNLESTLEELSTAVDSFASLICFQTPHQTDWLESLDTLQPIEWSCFLDLSVERLSILVKLFLSLPPSKQWEITNRHVNFPLVLISALKIESLRANAFCALALCVEGDSAKGLQGKLFKFLKNQRENQDFLELLGLFIEKLLPIIEPIDLQNFAEQCALCSLIDALIDSGDYSDPRSNELALLSIVVLMATSKQLLSIQEHEQQLQRYSLLIANTIAFSKNEVVLDHALRFSNQLPRLTVSNQIARERREHDRFYDESSVMVESENSNVLQISNKENTRPPRTINPQLDEIAAQLQSVVITDATQQNKEWGLDEEKLKAIFEAEKLKLINQHQISINQQIKLQEERLRCEFNTRLEEERKKAVQAEQARQSAERQLAETGMQLSIAQSTEIELRNQLEANIAEYQQIRKDNEVKVKELNAQIVVLREDLTEAQNSVQKMERQLELETCQSDGLACQLAEKDMLLAEKEQELSLFKEKIELHDKEKLESQENLLGLRNEFDRLNENLSLQQRQYDEIVNRLNETIIRQRNQIKESEDYAAQLEEDLDKHVRAINILQSLSVDTRSRQRKRGDVET